MKKSYKILSIGAVGILSSALMTTPSFAESSANDEQPYSQSEPDADGWFHYEGALPADAEIHTIQGTSDGEGGCHFEDGASLAPGEDLVSTQEVAYNPETCESRLATSETPIGGEDVPPSERGVGGQEGQAELEAAQAPSEDTGAQQTRSSGHLWSWYEDPPGIKVTEVENRTTWSWDGSNVLSSPAPVGGYTIDYFSTSGWGVEEQDWQNSYNSEETTSSTYTHFRNGIFCAFITTHVYADRNTVHGQADGNLNGNWSWRKSGGCNGLLSFNSQLERTQN